MTLEYQHHRTLFTIFRDDLTFADFGGTAHPNKTEAWMEGNTSVAVNSELPEEQLSENDGKYNLHRNRPYYISRNLQSTMAKIVVIFSINLVWIFQVNY